MTTLAKSFLYFTLTVLIGNILFHLWGFLNIGLEGSMNLLPDARMFFGLILLTGLFSLPLFIPIIIFFTLIKTFRPYFPVNIICSALFGLLLSLGWVLILNIEFNWLEEVSVWLPFVLAASAAGAIVELMQWPIMSNTSKTIILD